MKAGSVLVNTARGAIVDEQALIDVLRTGPLAAAGLDVFAEEPLPADHPLRVAAQRRTHPACGLDRGGGVDRVRRDRGPAGRPTTWPVTWIPMTCSTRESLPGPDALGGLRRAVQS